MWTLGSTLKGKTRFMTGLLLNQEIHRRESGRNSLSPDLRVSISMIGPRRISQASFLRDKVGVYLLSRDGRKVEYVGRSDKGIAQDVTDAAHRFTGIQFFWYEECPSPAEAHKRECELYHHYDQRSPLLNAKHPAAPEGESWRCPIAGCSFGEARMAWNMSPPSP